MTLLMDKPVEYLKELLQYAGIIAISCLSVLLLLITGKRVK